MNIKNRLTRIESGLNIKTNFCACPRVLKVVPPEDQTETLDACETCGKPVPEFSGFFETEVLVPEVNFTKEEFGAWQDEHVISRHSTFEQFLAQQKRA